MSGPDGPAGAETAPPRRGACGWTVERLRGPVSVLLEAAEPLPVAARLARIHTVEGPGLVLGSTQRLEIAHQGRVAVEGAEVLRRRSGGGAVLLSPGGQVWVDFFLPASDPLWHDDVAIAAGWVGELWSAVIEPFVALPVSIHSGRLEADRWGRLVCFAGAGPGEVFVGGLKVVGVSQRRSRRRARIQTMARLRHRPPAAGGPAAGTALDELELLDITPAERAAGREAVTGRGGSIPATESEMTDALVQALEAEGRGRW